MIILEHVNKYFYRHKKNEIHVINDTSLKLDKIGLVSLLGPSGCGKTTLLNVIGGLDKVNKGKIYINGRKLTKSTRRIDEIRNVNIGYIFQDYNLVDNMTVFDNVALSLKLIGVKNKNEIKKKVNYVLEKVDMYKYRNRLASMLSGGQRQRVGIARAIVKNPNIIIADEPTGNLDSKNTIEVMNIIKTISKEKLVILVTHERNLAEFYSTRIIEIEDGKVISDKENEHNNKLDYRMDNRIYLKDFKNQKNITSDDLNINYYANEKNKLDINIVVQNGNIYIENKGSNKLEIVDNNVELIDDHYKEISKEDTEKNDFDLKQLSNKKTKYSSILNPFSLLIEGFKKVRDYTFVKKLLIIGFFVSGIFMMYSISSLFGVRRISEDKYLKYNKNYLLIENDKTSEELYDKLMEDENINYIIPTDSFVNFYISYEDYFQTNKSKEDLFLSLSGISMLTEADIIYGTYPSNNNEIVIDERVYEQLERAENASSLGIKNASELIGRELTVDFKTKYKIVGITSQNTICVYLSEEEFFDIFKYISGISVLNYEDNADFKLKRGKLPLNDDEIVVNYNYKDYQKLNKKVIYDNHEYKVVGYYTSNKYGGETFTNKKTIEKLIFNRLGNISIYSKNKELTIEKYQSITNISDTYINSKEKYLDEKEEDVKTITKTSIIFMVISAIEIYLIMRSSFLSRIKEVGIYRAIGIKKKDIYKMFTGEIISITTFGSIIGIILMAYVLKQLSFISILNDKFQIDTFTVVLTIAIAYTFNLFVGLLPVYRVIRKTPAQILSRNDI